jgi:uncharacterized membrane protein
MRILQFVKTTVVGGLVFLLPFAFVLFAVSYVIAALLPLFNRVADRLHVPLIGGATLLIILVTGAVVFACFLAGLVAQSFLGRSARNWIETNLLGRVAVYRILQSVGTELDGDGAKTMQTALVWTDGWQLAFVVERHPDGNVTVVVPDPPMGTSGTILHLPGDRVHALDAKVGDVLKIQRRMGFGAAALLDGKVPPPPTGA